MNSWISNLTRATPTEKGETSEVVFALTLAPLPQRVEPKKGKVEKAYNFSEQMKWMHNIFSPRFAFKTCPVSEAELNVAKHSVCAACVVLCKKAAAPSIPTDLALLYCVTQATR